MSGKKAGASAAGMSGKKACASAASMSGKKAGASAAPENAAGALSRVMRSRTSDELEGAL
jgi:hypothetical protein